MAISIEKVSGGRSRVVVQGNMTIYEAAADKPALLGALEGAAELEIDISAVAEMDTAGLQLLILVKRESLKAGKALRLTGHGEAALDVMDRYNLGAYFGDPVVIPPRRRRKGERRGARSRS